MRRNPFNHPALLALTIAWPSITSLAQNIAWTGPTGITGDANLSRNGTYLDALILNTAAGGVLTADGVVFKIATAETGGTFGDGTINYVGTGLNDFSWAG